MSQVMPKKKERQPLWDINANASVSKARAVRKPAAKYEDNPYAACVFKFGNDGKEHLYLNAGIPQSSHPSEGICRKCGHAYSHMIGKNYEQCRECDGDRIAMLAQQLEREGIELGWGFYKGDARDHERERMGTVKPSASIQHDAREV